MQTILFTILAVAISVLMGLFLAQVINAKASRQNNMIRMTC